MTYDSLVRINSTVQHEGTFGRPESVRVSIDVEASSPENAARMMASLQLAVGDAILNALMQCGERKAGDITQ